MKYKGEVVDIIENYLLTNNIITVKRSDIRKWIDENYEYDEGVLKNKNKAKIEEKIFQQWFY